MSGSKSVPLSVSTGARPTSWFLVCTLGLLVGAATLDAQEPPELEVRTEAISHPLAECPAWDPGELAEPAPQRLEEAQALSSAATEAALLGDQQGVRDLLRRATSLNPLSQDLAYGRARAHEELGENEQAIRWYCRALALAPPGEDAGDTRERLERLQAPLGPAIAENALERFAVGVRLMEADSLEAATEEFSSAFAADSALADALYNRGLANGALRRSDEAVADFRAYLARRPEASDRAQVEDAIAFLEEPPVSYGPGTALTLGLLLPGAGQFYVDRNLMGTLLMGGAVGAVATGLLYKEMEVICLSIPRDGRCPEDDVVSRSTSRPLLTPGLAVAGVGALVGAILAYRTADSRNDAAGRLRIAEFDGEVRVSAGIAVASPGPGSPPARIALELVRLRF